MDTVRLPAVFERYACRRSLVCCRHPIRAPCDATEERRIATALASSAAGRALLPIFSSGFADDGGERVFAQHDERCVHLTSAPPGHTPEAPAEPACALQLAAGTDGLATGCHDFPRRITRLPQDNAGDPALEALFLMACPTAARMMVADPSPFRFAEIPLARWHHPASRSTSRDALQAVTPLRAGWWGLLSEGRDDPERLAHILAALHAEPLSPPARLTGARGDAEALLAGLPSVELGFVFDALARDRSRGGTYAALRWELRRDLTHQVSRARLLDALDIAPPLLFALVDHHVPFAGVHDARPAGDWLRTAARRAVACARLADALLARVPFRIDTLFGDLCAAVMHLDAARTGRHAQDADRS